MIAVLTKVSAKVSKGEVLTMKLYWQERRMGERLILALHDENEVEVGAVRKTPRGFDALAKTNTYDPGRAQKGFVTIEEAKAFVEAFHPWDLFGGDLDLEVEPDVRSLPADTAEQAPEEFSQTDAPAGVTQPVVKEPAQSMTSEETSVQAESGPGPSTEGDERPGKRGWKIWKKG